jgi:hypothetical protein
MAKKSDTPTRRDVIEKIDDSKKTMESKEVDLEKITEDIETVRQTLERLDFRGTAEGSEQVEKAIESAEDDTKRVFDKEDEDLNRLQAHGQEYEKKLEEKRGYVESDLGKISDSSAKIETTEAINRLVEAKEAAIREVDFLAEQVDRARHAREKSDRIQEKNRHRVHTSPRNK